MNIVLESYSKHICSVYTIIHTYISRLYTDKLKCGDVLGQFKFVNTFHYSHYISKYIIGIYIYIGISILCIDKLVEKYFFFYFRLSFFFLLIGCYYVVENGYKAEARFLHNKYFYFFLVSYV